MIVGFLTGFDDIKINLCNFLLYIFKWIIVTWKERNEIKYQQKQPDKIKLFERTWHIQTVN